jgi:hypothetical protein
VSKGRHEGRGRAYPTFGLDASRRRKVAFAIILGREIDPTEEPYARDKASRVVSRLPHALFMGLVFGFMASTSVNSFFPLTPATTALLVLGAACVAIYVVCLVGGVRVWWWLRQRS